MGRQCSVKGCESGSGRDRKRRSELKKRIPSIFNTPRDDELFKLWKNTFSYLKKSSKVCERHFLQSDVIKEHKTVLKDGSTHVIPRDKHLLKKDAVPQEEVDSDESNAEEDEIIIIHKNLSDKKPCNEIDPLMEEVPKTEIIDDLSHNTSEVSVNGHGMNDNMTNNHFSPSKTSEASPNDNTDTSIGQNQSFQTLEEVKVVLEQYRLPERWSWVNGTDKIFFCQLDKQTASQRLTLIFKDDFTFWMRLHNGNFESISTSARSYKDLLETLKRFDLKKTCYGTDMEEKEYADECVGCLMEHETYQSHALLRCKKCRVLRAELCSKKWYGNKSKKRKSEEI